MRPATRSAWLMCAWIACVWSCEVAPAVETLTPIANPRPILDDWPGTSGDEWSPLIQPISPRDYPRYRAPAMVNDPDGDLTVRAWSFSPSIPGRETPGIIETENRLSGKRTAVVVVHPWGIEDGQGWQGTQAYNRHGYAFCGLWEDNVVGNRHMRGFVKPLVDGLRDRVALTVFSLPGVADPIRKKAYRDYDHQPTEAQRAEGRRELGAYLRGLTGNQWPEAIPLNKSLDGHAGDVIAYDGLGYERLRDFLQAAGVTHVILAGYNTDMCIAATTAGYRNLTKDFDVFLVGDATLCAWPVTTKTPNGYKPHRTTEELITASQHHGVHPLAITQSSWITRLDRFSSPDEPAGRDYEYTMTEVAPNPARHPNLLYLGGDPFVTHRLDGRAESWIRGGFLVPSGAKQFSGMAVKVSRDGSPRPLEIRFGRAPGGDDLGVGRIEPERVVPLYDVWQEARVEPRAVNEGQPIYWEIRSAAGRDPEDHYVLYGPKPPNGEASAAEFAPAYRVLTDRPQDRVETPGKEYRHQFVKELLGPYYVDNPALRLAGPAATQSETTIDAGWSLRHATDAEGVLAAAARDLAEFLAVRAGMSCPVAAHQSPLDAPRVIGLIVTQDASQLGGVNTDEGYRIEVKPDRVNVIGRHPRGVMRGVYWIEEMMRFRGGPCLARGDVVRNCRFRRRITTSISIAEMTYDAASYPLVYMDGLLRKISHYGFNAIWFEVNLEEVTAASRVFPELNDPEAPRRLGRLRDLVERARPLGIDVIPYLSTNYHHPVPEAFYKKHPDCRGTSWASAMCTSHPDVERYLGETVHKLFEAAPGLGGLVLIFDSEGFWHCGLRNQDKCPRCRNRKPDDIAAEFIGTIRSAMKEVNPLAELIVWSYGGATAPKWVDDLIPKLPKDVIFQSEFSKGTIVTCDGIRNATEDYNIATLGPSDVFVRDYNAARKAGLRAMAKTEHAISQEFVTVPYIPCMRQWHDRAAAMAKFELDGFLGNWCHYGFTPSRPAEILMWYSWTDSPPLGDLLRRLAVRDFGEASAPLVLRAWEHVTEGIRQFPYSDPIARYPGPLQKGPSQPLFLDPKVKSCGVGRAWQNDLRWTRPWGPAVAEKYLSRVEDEFGAGIDELSKARAVASPTGQAALDREIGVVETMRRSLHTVINLIHWVPVRDAYAAAKTEEERRPLREQLVAIGRDELTNAQAALPWLDADSRLGATSEAVGCRRGGLFSPALVRTKIAMLEDTLRQLAEAPTTGDCPDFRGAVDVASSSPHGRCENGAVPLPLAQGETP